MEISMASKNQPSSSKQAPDPATSYERAKPEKEAGMGRLDNNDEAVPSGTPDKGIDAVRNKTNPRRYEEAAGVQNLDKAPPVEEVDHSMKDEEPLGWDQAPMSKARADVKRHSRTDGKGGIKE
jgi:hypothetical protein